MRIITLTRGYEALVDDEDYERVMEYKWSAHVANGGTSVYGKRNIRIGDARSAQYLQNFILPPPLGFTVDHKDRNALNCQKDNLCG